MITERTPGLVGRVEDHLCSLPGVDTGLAAGAAFDVTMQCVSRHGCRIRAHHFSPENTGIELWDPIDLVVELIGQSQHVETVFAEAGSVLNAVDRGLLSNMVGWEPASLRRDDDGDGLLVLASGVVSGGSPQVELPSDLVAGLRALADRPGFTVRMNPSAVEYGWENVRQWVPQLKKAGSINPLTSRIRRWTNLAALVAVGVDPEQPIITSDILVAVRAIAVTHHDLARSTLKDLSWCAPDPELVPPRRPRNSAARDPL